MIVGFESDGSHELPTKEMMIHRTYNAAHYDSNGSFELYCSTGGSRGLFKLPSLSLRLEIFLVLLALLRSEKQERVAERLWKILFRTDAFQLRR
ncbi:hypothetical protein GWI33_016119 [Rhynchophorus ferrugineus]|uniref:Uncharacterized protein n=1 Tax=Rhynchophorus ferrugineus TaxID=354439 RepID=A0A834I433_RHYFE|nr:hypothetical protein GWI33_016119 [Rhynchophorus ferrugineus]